MAKILLVDDDIELTSLLTDILEMEGFDIVEANNGIEGLAKIDTSIDLVLLDVMMPKMNGTQMLRKLRELATPVLMLTAKGEEIDRVLGLELGADDYLPKPFSDRELLARIRAILRRTQLTENNLRSNEPECLSYQDIDIYPGRQEVFCLGESIEMTGTELALLSYLIQHPGKIIAKNELSMEVLGKRLAQFDRAIDMHVSNLRKKLPERVDGKPRIKTLRGKGYLLVEEL